jgi:hypothetical protein
VPFAAEINAWLQATGFLRPENRHVRGESGPNGAWIEEEE